jgi:FAD/FMN-containing dehydrogenase
MYAGVLRFRGHGLGDVMERWFRLDRAAPDELTTQAVAWWSTADEAPALTIIVAWRGVPEAGDHAVRELLDHPARYETDLRSMSWLELQAHNTPIPFGLRHYWKGHLVREASAGLADAVAVAAQDVGENGFVLVEPIHGAAHRVPTESAAFGGRRAAANVTALAIWEHAADDAERIDWARRAASLFEPFSLNGGGYLNYPEVDQSAARVAAAFGPETFARLRQVKRTCDPDNRFRFNSNIPPA